MTTILQIDRSVYAELRFFRYTSTRYAIIPGFAIPANNLQFHSFDSLHVAIPRSANVSVGI